MMHGQRNIKQTAVWDRSEGSEE